MGDIERELTVFVVLLRNVFVCNGKMVCFFFLILSLSCVAASRGSFAVQRKTTYTIHRAKSFVCNLKKFF